MTFVPPTAGVFDAPAVSISLNVEWRSYVIGVLESLLSSPAYELNSIGIYDRHAAPVWEGDEETVYTADQQIELLMNALVKGNAMLPGMVIGWSGPIAPAGWLLCDGTIYEKIDYPFLWGVLSAWDATYEEDDDNFKTPDLRGRVVVGFNGFDNPVGGDISERNFGDADGEEAHVLLLEELAPHSHQIGVNTSGTGSSFPHGFNEGTHPVDDYGDTGTSPDTDATPHNNMQPFHVLNYIIKT